MDPVDVFGRTGKSLARAKQYKATTDLIKLIKEHQIFENETVDKIILSYLPVVNEGSENVRWNVYIFIWFCMISILKCCLSLGKHNYSQLIFIIIFTGY